jgi:uncharacterized membrane protein YdfJ with MMPL/SSD domain
MRLGAVSSSGAAILSFVVAERFLSVGSSLSCLNKYVRVAISSAEEAILISVINVIAGLIAILVFNLSIIATLGLILLVESAALMLVGGALGLGGQEGIRKLASTLTKVDFRISEKDLQRSEMKAAIYSLTGVLLFVESFVLADVR